MDYTFKKADIKDWQLYKKIRLETLEKEPQAFSSTYNDALTYTDLKWQELVGDTESAYILVLVESNVIGVGRITFNDPEEPNDVAILGGIYVNKSYRGLGIGKKLVNALLDIATKKKGIKKVRLSFRETQLNAIRLYTNLGFVEIGHDDDEFIMEKNL